MRQLKITNRTTYRTTTVARYLTEVKEELLTAEQEFELALLAKKGDEPARQQIIRANLRFVITVAKRYADTDNLDDLIQAGNIGLIKAFDKYEPERGFKFISYAVWWIRQSIMLAMRDKEIIRIPGNHLKHLKEIKTLANKEFAELGYSNQSAKFKDLKPHHTSINVQLSHESDSMELWEILPDDCPATDTFIENETLRNFINANLQNMTPISQRIIKGFFGIEIEAKSLLQIALEEKLSHERIRQLKDKALRQLRKNFKNTDYARRSRKISSCNN